jgi:hypothetical protein
MANSVGPLGLSPVGLWHWRVAEALGDQYPRQGRGAGSLLGEEGSASRLGFLLRRSRPLERAISLELGGVQTGRSRLSVPTRPSTVFWRGQVPAQDYSGPKPRRWYAGGSPRLRQSMPGQFSPEHARQGGRVSEAIAAGSRSQARGGGGGGAGGGPLSIRKPGLVSRVAPRIRNGQSAARWDRLPLLKTTIPLMAGNQRARGAAGENCSPPATATKGRVGGGEALGIAREDRARTRLGWCRVVLPLHPRARCLFEMGRYRSSRRPCSIRSPTYRER